MTPHETDRRRVTAPVRKRSRSPIQETKPRRSLYTATQQPSDAETIEVAIQALGDTPRPQGSKPLKGYSSIWRIGVGNHRVCYQVDDEVLLVLVITISTRDDVYEALPLRRHLGH